VAALTSCHHLNVLDYLVALPRSPHWGQPVLLLAEQFWLWRFELFAIVAQALVIVQRSSKDGGGRLSAID
jgi:hypothetical protein